MVMDWVSFCIGLSIMGGFWVTAVIAIYLAYKAKKEGK
jgi:hypothetical protein